MRESEFEEYLKEVLQSIDEDDNNIFVEQPKRVKTYDEAGVLTSNKGIVVTMKDGSEFQVTIVKSR